MRTALQRDDCGELQWNRRGKEIMLDIVRGVHFLHANGVLHRDLKSPVSLRVGVVLRV